MSKRANAEKIKVNKPMMLMANAFTDTYGIVKMEALILDDCVQTMIDDFSTTIKKLSDPAFEQVISVNDKGEKVKVLMRIEEEAVKELVLFVVDEEIVMVRMYGDIRMEDIQDISKQYGAKP